MTQAPSTSVKDEATRLLNDVVERLSGPDPDIAFALRTTVHACNLMGWADAAKWFSAEIEGYANAEDVPEHRRVSAYETWRPDNMRGVMEQAVMTSSGHADDERKTVPWVLTGGIESVLATAQHGRIVRSGPDEERLSGIRKRPMMGRLATIVDAAQAQNVVQRLRNIAFAWASRNYAALQLGDAATDAWHQYRAQVDEFVGQMNLAGHVSSITDGLASSEPQRWREAMWSSRDLLHDVAERLWKDPRKTYEHLADEDGSPIEVTSNRFVNRLMAYMHQKGITGTLGGALRAEWARLRGLNSLASSAHEEGAVTHEDARLAFFAIYMLLGEIVLRTDCEPVEKYE